MKLLIIYANKFAYKTSLRSLESASETTEQNSIENAVGGLIGRSNGHYNKSFWDTTVNPLITGLGSGSDPNVISATTSELQIESTFVDEGWDFLNV